MSRAQRSDVKPPWYTHKKGEDVHELLYKGALHLAQRNGRREYLRTLRKIFMDEPLDPKIEWFAREARSRWNVVASGVETLCARYAKTRPKPMMMTLGGNRKLQQRARAMTSLLDGEFERLDVYDFGEKMTLDSGVYGHGALHVCVGDGKPDIDLEWCGDLHVDPREERARKVLTLYRTKRVDKYILADRYPKFKAQIMDSRDGLDNETETDEDYDGAADLVLVVESWRFTGEKTGRYACCVEQATLDFDEWKRPRPPFVEFPWTRDPARYFGVGEVERTMGVQSELNELSGIINQSYRTWVGRACLDTSMGVSANQVGNDVGELLEFNGGGTGIPPITHVAPPAVSADFLGREQQLQQMILEMRGIGMHSATSRAPETQESGKARIVQQDVESGRHFPTEKRLEIAYVRVAEQLRWRLQDIVAEGSNKSFVALGGKHMLEQIDFKANDLTDDESRIRVMATANLSRTPHALIAELKELIAMGAITDPMEIREKLELPDLDRANDVGLAPRRLAQKLIEKALDGERVTAEPYMDLGYALVEASAQLCLAQLDDVDEAAIDALADLVGSIEELQRKATAPAANGPAMPGAPPMGPGGAPPPAMPGPMM